MLICLVMLIPIVPLFLIGEERIGELISQWTGGSNPVWKISLVLFFVLASDILLPVPSSVVNTLAGGQLGTALGTLVCWMGMNVGAIFGFWLGRIGGQRIALFFSNAQELGRTQTIIDRYGQFALIVVRGVPVLAEASVLLAGIHEMAWKKFLPPVLLSNFVLAFTYAAFGNLANEMGWFALSIIIAIIVPVMLLVVFKKLFETEIELPDSVEEKISNEQ